MKDALTDAPPVKARTVAYCARRAFSEASYYTWIDRFDTFGLGGFFPKNVDGRIDDPNAGWKGKALWSTSGTRTMFHLEGGKENRPKAARFQLRPNPLAR